MICGKGRDIKQTMCQIFWIPGRAQTVSLETRVDEVHELKNFSGVEAAKEGQQRTS